MKDSCHRYLAIPDSNQSYFDPPYDKEKNDCDHYMNGTVCIIPLAINEEIEDYDNGDNE